MFEVLSGKLKENIVISNQEGIIFLLNPVDEIIADLSGRNVPIKMLNASVVSEGPKPNSKSISLSGGNSYIEIPREYLFNPTSDIEYTVECWCKSNTGKADLLTKWSPQDPHFALYTMCDYNIVSLAYQQSGYNSTVTTNDTFLKDKWNHIALTKKDNVFKLYVNGQLKSTSSPQLTYPESLIDFHINNYYANYPNKYDVSGPVYISEFAIYNVCKYNENFSVT